MAKKLSTPIAEEESTTLSENLPAQKPTSDSNEVTNETSFSPTKRAENRMSLKKIDSDHELDAVFEENRGFATDMLKLPKYSTVTTKSSSSDNLSKKSDPKEEKTFRRLSSKFVTKKFILDSLDEILDIW